MGSSVSRVAAACFTPTSHERQDKCNNNSRIMVCSTTTPDGGLGHSFCYVRPTLDLSSNSSADFSSNSYSHSSSSFSEARTSSSQEQEQQLRIDCSSSSSSRNRGGATGVVAAAAAAAGGGSSISETSFKSISGASVSANTSTSRSISSLEQFNSFSNGPSDRAAAFESTPSFTALPLQPIPRGTAAHSGPISAAGSSSGVPLERGLFVSGPLERGFMSGPLERGFMSGPLERGFLSGPLERSSISSGPLDKGYLSGPLELQPQCSGEGMLYSSSGSQGRRKKSLADYVKGASIPMRKALSRTIAKGRKSFTESVRQKRRAEHQRTGVEEEESWSKASEEIDRRENLQWAQGKAGEDRVHIVLSEEHGWMFVGIYDGFNGPDAPDFLMSNLYPAIYKELEGLLWDQKEAFGLSSRGCKCEPLVEKLCRRDNGTLKQLMNEDSMQAEKARTSTDAEVDGKQAQDRTFCGSSPKSVRRKKSRKLFQWRYEWEQDSSRKKAEDDSDQEVDSLWVQRSSKRRGPVDHSAVLKALERALIATEEAYLEMTERAVMDNPELAVVGSCLLVMLMKDEDVYVMNVGDSRAVLAQDTRPDATKVCKSSNQGCENSKEADQERIGARDSLLRMELERIIEETPTELAVLEATSYDVEELAPPPISPFLGALQLSCDHSTSVEEEILRIRMGHPDDEESITNDRVKGRLKVTRAFGAGFLKQPRLNDALLEMFRIDFIGEEPYITCAPSLQHHRLGSRDQFLVLSSDGLYQYLTNEEVVAHVEWFLEKFPDGDPAQYLIEELLFRAAKKAGMDFHELLDIPQGDRRRYHDDVSLIVISLEGRIWRSSS